MIERNVPYSKDDEGQDNLIGEMDNHEDDGLLDGSGYNEEYYGPNGMANDAEVNDGIRKGEGTQGSQHEYPGEKGEELSEGVLYDDPSPYDLDDPEEIISKTNDMTVFNSNTDPWDDTYGSGSQGQGAGISDPERTSIQMDPSRKPDTDAKGDPIHGAGGMKKQGSLTELEKDPGKGIVRYSPVAIFLMTVMALFYANLFLAFFILVIGPVIIIPELGDTEFWILGGFAEVSGAAAMFYYILLTIIIILCFYKAIKDDGKELVMLFSRVIRVQLATEQVNIPFGNEKESAQGSDPHGEEYGKKGEGVGIVFGPGHAEDKEPHDPPTLFSPYLNNTFTLVAFFFFAVYAFEVVLDIVLIDIIGIERHYPSSIFDMPAWERLWNLPEAPVLEELIFRLLCIGVPLYIIRILGARKVANGLGRTDPMSGTKSQDPSDPYGYLHAPSSPGTIPTPYALEPKQDPQGIRDLFAGIIKKENRKFFIGGGFEINTQTMSLLLLSSFMFSVAHIGWDWTKLIPTFLGGMMLGYLFLRKGLHASILLHFAINSFAIAYITLGEHLFLELWLYFIYYGSIPFGLYFLYFYLKRFRRDLEMVNLDYRTKEFSRALTATGGTIVFLVVIIGIIMTAYELNRDEYGSNTEVRYLEQGKGDYIILQKGEMVKDESINGSLYISGEGELELIILNSTLRDQWKAGEEIDNEDYLLFRHITSSGEREEEVLFDLTIEKSESICIILKALNRTSYQLNVTTTQENLEVEDLNVVYMCCFPIIIACIFIGFGTIYTSNYYDYTGKQTLDKHPGFQVPYPGSPYPPPQGGMYPPPGYPMGQYPPPDQYQQYPPAMNQYQHQPMLPPPDQYQQYPPAMNQYQHLPMSPPPGQYQQYPPPQDQYAPYQSYPHTPLGYQGPPTQPIQRNEEASIHDKAYQTHAYDPWAGDAEMDSKLDEYPERDEQRNPVGSDRGDPLSSIEERHEQFMEKIEIDKDMVSRPPGKRPEKELEKEDTKEDWII